MSDIAIKVEDVGKLYRLGQIGTGTISHDLNRWYAKMRGKEDPFAKIGETNDRTTKGESDYVWALKNIDFEVKQGEVLGIIGRNGAGKSTLLKILSKVTTPTTGRIKVKGRIASLLEVGTGFHPELTGRENVFLNGAILGMTKREIQSKFDEIVDFSGVERYIDTPVKRYSSGMYVRLAFAVAAFLEPEILIVDEVLAVGDVEFQKKCIGRMQDVSVNDGRTVLFVSHNMTSIKQLCHRGVILLNGTINFVGDITSAVRVYETQSFVSKTGVWINTDENTDTVRLEKITLKNVNGDVKSSFTNSEPIIVEFDLIVLEDCTRIKIGFDILKENEVAFRSQQVDNKSSANFSKGEKLKLTCLIPMMFLNVGVYTIRPIVTLHCDRSLLSFFEPVIQLEVELDQSVSDYHAILNENNHPGTVFPILQWGKESQGV